MGAPRSAYAIKGGDEGRPRLERMAELRAAATRALLEEQGVPEGGRCVDLGCGTGHVTRMLGELVGPLGYVLGIDLDERFIETNRATAAANVEFRVADLTTFTEGGFDVAYMGLVLMHLPDPDAVVARVVDLLVPGGVLICEEVDLIGSFCEPPSAVYDRALALGQELLDARTGRARVPFRLPAIFREAGLTDVGLSLTQYASGEADEKVVMSLSIALTADALVADGHATRAEVDGIVARLDELSRDPRYLFGFPRTHQVWGRVPGAAS